MVHHTAGMLVGEEVEGGVMYVGRAMSPRLLALPGDPYGLLGTACWSDHDIQLVSRAGDSSRALQKNQET